MLIVVLTGFASGMAVRSLQSVLLGMAEILADACQSAETASLIILCVRL